MVLLAKYRNLQWKQVHGSLPWRWWALWTEGWILLCVQCKTFLAAYNIARWWAVLIVLNAPTFSILSAVIKSAQEHSALQRMKPVISS